MESIWNGYIPYGFHPFHMDSIWNMFYHINHLYINMESTWIPPGFHMDSMFIPYGLIPYGFLVDSRWIPGGIPLMFLPKSNSQF